MSYYKYKYIHKYTANSWGLPGTQRRKDNRIIIINQIKSSQVKSNNQINQPINEPVNQ